MAEYSSHSIISRAVFRQTTEVEKTYPEVRLSRKTQCRGKGRATLEEEEEDFETRERTRAAANHATEASLAKAKENQLKACLSETGSCRFNSFIQNGIEKDIV